MFLGRARNSQPFDYISSLSPSHPSCKENDMWIAKITIKMRHGIKIFRVPSDLWFILFTA